jgi:hypothetical protein
MAVPTREYDLVSAVLMIIDTKKVAARIGKHLFHLYAIGALLLLFDLGRHLVAFESAAIQEGYIALQMLNAVQNGTLHTQN